MVSAEAVIARVRSDLSDDLIQDRISAWGPAEKSGGDGFQHSWTDTVCKDIGTTRHYITCSGESDGQQCLGRWSRRTREILPPGLHCVFGSHVIFDGTIISETSSPGDGRNLKKLRHCWAEHILNTRSTSNGLHQTVLAPKGGPLISQDELDMMRSFLQKAIAKSQASDNAKNKDGPKALGNGTGGRAGVTESGVVMKRDSGDAILGNGQDECYREPGGYFQQGDLEVWVTWHGWSSLAIRDGRWRPGFHYEILLGLFTTVIDYGTNRRLWRARDKPWIMAAEWIWLDTPNDVHSLFAEGVVKDLREIFKREVGRLQNTSPAKYEADKYESREAQYPLLLDRGGEFIATHLVGQPLTSDRGYALAWILCVPNDIQDYERDVLGGETNNLVRGLASSAQQVVDAAYMFLLLVEGAYAHKDFDMVDASMGVCGYFLMTWRYNTPRQFKLYDAVSIRDREFGKPTELFGLADLVEEHYPTSYPPGDTYGVLFDRVTSTIKESYAGCTCDSKPRGHDTYKMLAQALEDGDNEELEEQMHIEFSYLSIGASHGDIRCECGLDLAAYEGFVRFFDPDTGLVSRLHHKTSTSDGNALPE
uniref:Diterpene cyclase vniA n=1 Tax=Virgaria nigra TaxID=1085564 RepID=VNIA_VIRNI